jgi:4-diphosphocytidyl-2-C-methyl-D-erythritol kinase
MSLEKRVPVAAGLGGGSSDGAAALTQLSRLWKVPAGCADLLPMAEELGSDVPFFLYGGTALVEGRGEQVTPLPQPTSVWYLLVKPPFSVSTARVFAALPECEWTDGEKTRRLASDIRSRGRATLGVNSLQETLFRLYPEAQVCFEAVADLAPGQTLVSGSGPTVAASFPSREEAQRAAAGLAGRGFWMETVTPCSIEAWQAPCA